MTNKTDYDVKEERQDIDNKIKRFNFVQNLDKDNEFLKKAKLYEIEININNNVMNLYCTKTGKSISFPCSQTTLSSYKLYNLKKLIGEMND